MENYLGSEGLGAFLKSMKTYISNKTTTHVADLKGVTFLEDFEFQTEASTTGNTISKSIQSDIEPYSSIICVLLGIDSDDNTKYEFQYSYKSSSGIYNSSDDTDNSPKIQMFYESGDSIEIQTTTSTVYNCKLLVFGVNSLIS